jgi:hypothetical protein
VPGSAVSPSIARTSAVLGAALLLWAAPGRVAAQNDLTITAAAVTIPTPGVAQFDAGFSGAASFGFSVGTPFGNANAKRFISVQITCTAVTNGKPCGDVQWRLTSPETTPWTDFLTNVFVTALQRCVVRSNNATALATCPPSPPATTQPYSGTFELRMKLSWTADAPATYAATVRVRLEVVTP